MRFALVAANASERRQVGAPGEASCSCGVAYVPPGQRAAEEVRQHPEESDRSIAARIGVHHSTVNEARKRTVGNPTVAPRTGRDGKTRRMPRKTDITDATREAMASLLPERERRQAGAVLDEGKPMEQVATH